MGSGTARPLCPGDRSNSRRRPSKGDIKFRSRTAEHFNKIAHHLPEVRDAFQETMSYCASTNPRAVRFIVLMMAIYLHLGPFSRRVIAEIDGRTAAKDSRSSRMPVAAHAHIAATPSI